MIEAAGGLIQRRVFWVADGGQARLLPIGLQQKLPPGAPLLAEARIRLHPPARVRVELSSSVPKAGQTGAGHSIRVRVLDSTGKALRGRRVDLRCSVGRLAEPVESSPGVFSSLWTPPAGVWGRAVLSAVDRETSVGAVSTVLEQKADP